MTLHCIDPECADVTAVFGAVQGYLTHSGTRDDRERVDALKIGKAMLDSAACRPSVYAAEHELSCVPPSGVAGRPSSLDIREPCLHRGLLPLPTPPPSR